MSKYYSSADSSIISGNLYAYYSNTKYHNNTIIRFIIVYGFEPWNIIVGFKKTKLAKNLGFMHYFIT